MFHAMSKSRDKILQLPKKPTYFTGTVVCTWFTFLWLSFSESKSARSTRIHQYFLKPKFSTAPFLDLKMNEIFFEYVS